MSLLRVALLLPWLLGGAAVARAEQTDVEARRAFRLARGVDSSQETVLDGPRLVHVLPRGHVLRPAHFGDDGVVARAVPTKFFGLRARRTMGRGSVVNFGDLETVPLVRRNEEVTAFIREGTLLITLRAVARSDAGLHQRVVMRNMTTRKQIEGVVVGPGQVRVELARAGALP